VLTEAGTYHIQGGVHVRYDLGGSSDYYMYSSILTFYIVDDNAPSAPQNFQISAPLFQNPILTWSVNTEGDLKGYTFYKKLTTSSGTITISIFTTNTSYTDDDFTVNYKWGKDTAEYWVVAEDINNNISGESLHKIIDGTSGIQGKINNQDANNELNYFLNQNYPNPFNPSTTIEFQITQNDFVNLTVYNSLGQQVSVLVNNTLGKGKYSVEFNAINLPSGIYIYKIQSDNFSTVKKMILTK